MLTKEAIRKTIDNLPDEILSIDEVVERLILLDKVEQGLQDVKDGKEHTTGKVTKKLEKRTLNTKTDRNGFALTIHYQ